MEGHDKVAEEKVSGLRKEKEEADKLLLNVEAWVAFCSILLFVGLAMVVSFCEMANAVRLLIIVPALVFFLVICFLCLRIEQKAGYYECGKCHHKYVPTYVSVCLAMHIGRTRYMKCPECEKRSWQKKVISKD